VHGESYCGNSETHNKRADVILCDAMPSPTPHVLTYSLASFSAWVAKLQSKLPLSPCDLQFVQGAYDQGSNPSLAMFVDAKGALGVAEIHDGAVRKLCCDFFPLRSRF
jgi:hypothetical protein